MSNSVDFNHWVEDLPLLHSWDRGVTWNTGGFNSTQFKNIRSQLEAASINPGIVLETGAGNTSLFFLLWGWKLTSIAPDRKLFERIRDYLGTSEVTSRWEIIEDGSEFALPVLTSSKRTSPPFLDLLLIDGCHGTPSVFIDFFYGNWLLKKGGIIWLDDIRIHSVQELARTLDAQPGWEVFADIGKSLLFRKTMDSRQLGDWVHIPYILTKTMQHDRRYPESLHGKKSTEG